MEIKTCQIHQIKKSWMKDSSKKGGGRWRCRECSRQHSRNYRTSNASTLTQVDRERMAKYRETSNDRIKLNRNNSQRKWRRIMTAVLRLDKKFLSTAGLKLMERAMEERHRLREMSAIRRANELRATCRKCRGNGYAAAATGPCWICLSRPASETDHVVPLSKGGRHCNNNFLGACGSCNRSKSYRVWPGQPEWKSFLASRRNQG